MVDSLNYNKKTYKNSGELFRDYFSPSSPTVYDPVVIPRQSSLFKYQIGDKIFVDFPKSKRKEYGFKYSLEVGEYIHFSKIIMLIQIVFYTSFSKFSCNI